MLTASQIEEIVQIIKEHFGAVSFLVTGVLPYNLDVADLKEKGLIAADVPEDLVKDSFVFGMLSGMSPDMNFDEIKTKLALGPKFPIEENAVKWLGENSSLYIQGLGNKIIDKSLHIVHDAEKEAAMRGKIQETLAEGAKARKTRGQMITMLRDATTEVTRDMHRVVNTELHNART